jgi:hypothetical protein
MSICLVKTCAICSVICFEITNSRTERVNQVLLPAYETTPEIYNIVHSVFRKYAPSK